MNPKITKTTLQRKFAGLVLYNSILAAILLVVLFGFWRYFQIVDNYKQQLNDLSSQHLAGIENSLWLMDNLQTRRQLNELRLILDLDYAEVINDGEKIAAVGSSVAEPLLSRSLNITRTEDNKVYNLGTLRIFIDGHSITSKLTDEILPLLAITLLAIIIPGVLINANMKKIVSNRLESIVKLLNQPGDDVDFQRNLSSLKNQMDTDEIDRLSEEISEFHRLNTTLNINLQQQQHQLRIIFENTGILFGLLDKEGKIININQAALDLNTNSKEDLLGTYFWGKLWSPWSLTNIHQAEELTEAAIKGSLVREEISFSSETGKYYLDFILTPIKNGDDVEFILVEAHDITQLKRWEVQQETQVKLLKYFMSEDNSSVITDKIVADIDLLLPPGVSLHIFKENNKRSHLDLVSGGLNNSTENISFQEIVSSLLKSDFSLKGPTTISFDNDSLQLTPEIINLTDLLSFNRLYVEPISIQSGQDILNSYSIITIDKGIRISSFVTQLCSLCSSLAGLALQREQQQKITEEVEENMGEVVNSSLDGILVLNQKGNIISANHAFSELVAKDRQQIVSKDFWDIVVSLTKSETLALISSTQVSGKQKYQITLEQKSVQRHCEVTLVTIGEKNPQFYAFFQDRTEQQLLIEKLEQQYQFIRTVLDNTTDAILACDENGKVTLFNHRVSWLLKHSDEPIKEDEWSDLIQLYETDGITKLAQEQYPLMRTLREGNISDLVICGKFYEDKMLNLVCNGARLYSNSGEIIGAVLTAHDVTEEYKTRLELENHQHHLEDLVDHRTKDLQLANDELEAFAYSVSHDLRAPLRSITGFAEILNEDYSGLISKSGQDLLNRIMKNATNLGGLIENLLMLSKISRTSMSTERVEISAICEELLKEEHLTHANIEYEVEKNLTVEGDPGLIKILMKNLISNAVKYSSQTEQPVIRFYASNDKKSEFILKDNGVGFNSKFSDKIFKPFQRVHGDEYEGTGIGLSIVHRIIKRHQADIAITSEVNQGTSVRFSFPLKQSPA